MLFKFSTICRILYVELIKTPAKKKIDIMNYINAYRTGSNNVRVDYEIENKIVKVNWCNIDAGTGEELSSYYLENIVECDDRELEIIIKDAIDAGKMIATNILNSICLLEIHSTLVMLLTFKKIY